MFSFSSPARAIAAALAVSLVSGAVFLAAPAQAQFSEGYRFLEAVKKKDGVKVEEALGVPGSTVINTRDVTSGVTAMHIVTQRRDLTWLRYLAGKGANVNARDDRGETPLQLATNLGWVEGVDYLLTRGPAPEVTNNAGETPLISAVHRRNLTLMRVLLKAGANPDRADNSGRSARDYARLSTNDSQLLGAIEAHATDKPGPAAAGVIYGPTL